MKILLLKLLGLCNPKPLVIKNSTALIADGFAVFEKANKKLEKGLLKADEEIARIEDGLTDAFTDYSTKIAELNKESDAVEVERAKAVRLQEKLKDLLGA